MMWFCGTGRCRWSCCKRRSRNILRTGAEGIRPVMDVVEANAFSKLRGLAVKKLLTAKIAKDSRRSQSKPCTFSCDVAYGYRASQGYPNVLILYTFSSGEMASKSRVDRPGTAGDGCMSSRRTDRPASSQQLRQ